MTSSKPYLIKAFYDWISDNQLTPYVVVDTTVLGVQVPWQFVQDNQIVLNISGGAVGAISFGDNAIEFTARFSGKIEYITVPFGAVGAIYAKENGAGSSFPIEHDETFEEEDISTDEPSIKLEDASIEKPTTDDNNKSSSKKSGRPTLKVIK
ncbi:ClpXP protease specificity-enhancing factor [Thalassotalea sp. LPB0316]|nr:ClpXP protease specificity-enhancing factor [Thalassotalea sp. LPB0316]